MKEFNIEKVTGTEDTFNLTVNSFLSMYLSMDELKDLSVRLNEIIEKNAHISYTLVRNKKSGRFEKVFDND